MGRALLITIFTSTTILAFSAGYWVANNKSKVALVSPVAKVIPLPLERYAYENLAKRGGVTSQITIDKTLKVENGFATHLVSFLTDGKKVTGQLNVPEGTGPFPAIIMFRGYVDSKEFVTGTGTAPSARVYAKSGFITFAPDFLGYGGSDKHEEGSITARLENYTTALDALATLENYKDVNKKNIFIWGHSNGGHLAVATIEISGKNYPTTLWAPVTAPFPHSSLFYQDELADKGKQLRKDIADFEELYDVFRFSVDSYFSLINAPLQLHQGSADIEVPKHWSDTFVKELKNKEKDITYFVYTGANHNMQPAWDTVVSRDLKFFRKHLQP